MKRFALLVALASLLFNGGCASLFISKGVTPTDLSAVHVGATRASVERVLGDPVRSEIVGGTKLSTYRYNLGRAPEHVDEREVAEELYVSPILGPVFLAWVLWEYQKQRGEILVAYGPDERVRGVGRTKDEVERHVKAVEQRRKKRLKRLKRVVARAEQGAPSAQFEVAQMRAGREGWRWLCLSANQGHDAAQIGMGDYYLSGGVWPAATHSPDVYFADVIGDRVRAYVWYSLAASKENELGSFKREWVSRLMTLEQMVEAERLLADWQPEKCAIESSEPVENHGWDSRK